MVFGRAARVTLLALGSAALLHGAAVGCRTVSDEKSMQIADVEERQWFDAKGDGGVCEAPPKACPAIDHEAVKDFTERCVTAGHQAKACGCNVKCSGRLAPAEGAAAAAQTGSPAPASGAALTASGCSADARGEIAAAAQGRRAGTAFDRCAKAHVCRGQVSGCQPEDAVVTTRLRALGKGACGAEVLDAFCREGYDDTFQCPVADISLLSKLVDDMDVGTAELRRCVRGVACGGGRAGCGKEALARADMARDAVSRDGCEYWLRVLCSVSGR